MFSLFAIGTTFSMMCFAFFKWGKARKEVQLLRETIDAQEVEISILRTQRNHIISTVNDADRVWDEWQEAND